MLRTERIARLDMAGAGCGAGFRPNENHTKDIDFSPTGIRLRWEAGRADTARALRRAPWNDACDPLEGVILHEPMPDTVPAVE